MIDIQNHEMGTLEASLQAMRAQAQAQEVVLDDYKTELCCLDKPELMALARTIQQSGMRKYTAKTPNYIMIGHLMTAKRRVLGHEALLDRIDAMQARLASCKGGH